MQIFTSGENFFQALAITASTAIAFETIGRDNPLAATTFCLVISAYNIPISYMLFVDGAGYASGGVAGSYGDGCRDKHHRQHFARRVFDLVEAR